LQVGGLIQRQIEFIDIRRNPPRPSLVSNFTVESPARLILEIDIGERLFVVVADDETRGLFLNGPRRREAAGRQVLCYLPQRK